MGRFLGSRLLFYIAAFMVAVTFNFVLPRMMPGDPFEIMFAAAQGKIQPEQMAVLKEQFGFVAGPWHVQYWDYIKGIPANGVSHAHPVRSRGYSKLVSSWLWLQSRC